MSVVGLTIRAERVSSSGCMMRILLAGFYIAREPSEMTEVTDVIPCEFGRLDFNLNNEPDVILLFFRWRSFQ